MIAMIKTTGKEKDYELIEYILNVNTQYTQVLMELNENGAMDAVYTYGVSRLTEDRFTGESNFYLYDPAGNVAGITDQNGYLWQSYCYDAFGNATFGSPQYDNEHTFNAESYNPNIRSQYLRARYYDMVKGNFLTEDSYLGDIRNPLTLNRYSYCIGNPLFYSDPSGHDVKSFVKTALFGNEKVIVIEAKNRLIAKGDKWAEKVIQDYLIKQNKFMDDTYDWYGRNPLMSNDTTYGQINNNFTAGVVGSAYKITNPKYIAANAYSAAAHPLQTLDRININGQDALNGVMGIADKIRNKEYGALARGAGYAAGSVAQVYLLGKGIEKCGDLIDERKYRLNSVNSGSVSASKIGNTNQVEQNFTREDIISSLDGVTDKSAEIANALKNKEIGLNVLGDELIERYYGYDLDTVAFQEGKQIYVRSSSSSLISDVVHEGTHAIDFSQDISQKIISSRAGEYKAYSAERLFQIEAGMPVDFMSEDDMLVHIWSNY